MFRAIENFFNSDTFMPHCHCILWQPDILWLHVISDGGIATSYFAISILVLYFLRKRADFPFNNIYFLFAAFIFFFGTTHFMGIWVLRHRDYAFEGVLKLLTVLASIPTLVAVVKLAPQILSVPSLAGMVRYLRRKEDLVIAEEEARYLDKTFKNPIEGAIDLF